MARQKKLMVRLTEKELEKLKQYAESEGIAMSDIVRHYIRSLPSPQETNKEV
jgi:predicted urease superfamily metal-dependent hydrolase